MELKNQLKEQAVKLKATAPDEKQLLVLRKTLAANKKGITAGMATTYTEFNSNMLSK